MAALKDVINVIKAVANMQPAVNSSYEGDPYAILNSNRQLRYATFVISQQKHTEDRERGIVRYRFYLIYADRLRQNLEENRIDIQSNGMDVLRNIIWTLDSQDNLDWEFDKITYHNFEQKFSDELAGCYADVTIEVPLDWICEEEFGELMYEG